MAKRLSPASALAAVEQATSADRSDLLRRLTKEMLLEPTRRIELDDLISQEVQRIMAVLNDPETVAGPLAGSNDERVIEAARRAADLWVLAEPFCASLQVAVRWGSPDVLDPWVNGLRGFLTVPHRIEGGDGMRLAQRHLPGMVGIATVALASVAAKKWENLRVLVVDPTVRGRHIETPLPLVEATAPFKPFDDQEWVSLILARAAADGKSYSEALKDYTERRQGKLYTPAAEWLHHILRPIFADQIADDATYDIEFDRMEAMLGALSYAQTGARTQVDSSSRPRPRSYWLGRATWRAGHGYGNPVEDLVQELASHGLRCGPLQAGLFGGDEERASSALNLLRDQFEQVARHRF